MKPVLCTSVQDDIEATAEISKEEDLVSLINEGDDNRTEGADELETTSIVTDEAELFENIFSNVKMNVYVPTVTYPFGIITSEFVEGDLLMKFNKVESLEGDDLRMDHFMDFQFLPALPVDPVGSISIGSQIVAVVVADRETVGEIGLLGEDIVTVTRDEAYM